jgi:hypothetical protein
MMAKKVVDSELEAARSRQMFDILAGGIKTKLDINSCQSAAGELHSLAIVYGRLQCQSGGYQNATKEVQARYDKESRIQYELSRRFEKQCVRKSGIDMREVAADDDPLTKRAKLLELDGPRRRRRKR